MSQQNRPPLDTLRNLGFSDMESAIYVDLLQHPGSTGYRIGKSINKPHANVYQALTGLEQKGAVAFEDGETRTYHATPPTELLNNLRTRYSEECAQAERALAALEVRRPDEERFFRLTSPDQVYARARAMIAEARETVLIEAFPVFMKNLRTDLEGAVSRDIAVAGLALDEADMIEGSRLHVSRMAGRVAALWRGHQLILITDAMEFLLALFDEDGMVVRAVSMTSPFVATVLNNGIVADVILHTLPQGAEIESLNGHLFGFLPPGCRELIHSQAWNEETAARAARADTSGPAAA